MPIKFRCPHCRQLLGIARAKAGLPVDCPTCGRTVRVPHLDGRVEPLSKPGLNLEDSSLVKALDQVALIGNLPPDEVSEVFAEFEPEPVEVAAIAAPKPIPVVIDAPAPAPPRPTPKVNGSPLPAAEEGAAFAEVSQLAGPGVAARPQMHAPPAPHGSRLQGWIAGLLAFAIGLSSFGVGYLVGSRSAGRPAPDAGAAAQPSVVPGNPAPAPARPAVRGRITYRTDAGDSRPDVGARVLIFPQQRQGEVKLAVTGFRAADSAIDAQVALASIRALGGEMAVVGDDGAFEAALPSAGAYQILVISHFQSHPEDAPLEAPVKRLLEAWFTRPEQLVGRLRRHLGQIRYGGDDVQLWDHSFEADV